MTWNRAALLAQLLLLFYYEFFEWVNVFPWNNVVNGNGQALLDIVLGVVLAGLLLGPLLRLRWLVGIGTVLFSLWLLLQIQGWWLPYFFGISASGRRFYQHWFSQTLKMLPRIADHPIPDAGHLVLQGCIVLALVTSGVTFWQWRKGKGVTNLSAHAA